MCQLDKLVTYMYLDNSHFIRRIIDLCGVMWMSKKREEEEGRPKFDDHLVKKIRLLMLR